MTDTNPRDLIKLLIDALKEECNWIDNPKHDELIAKATAYLTQPEPEPDDPDYYLAWLLFACDGKLRPEAQRVLAAYGIAQPKPKPPTDEEILALSQEHGVSYTMLNGGVIYGKREGCDMRDDVLSFARDMLARWGK